MKQPRLPERVALNFHSDPGHGWLEAPAQLVRDTHISGVISGYSYRSADNQTVYLEEDCDAPRLLQALKAKGVVVEVADVAGSNDDSFIRSLPRYTA
jgi:hypothetical protein